MAVNRILLRAILGVGPGLGLGLGLGLNCSSAFAADAAAPIPGAQSEQPADAPAAQAGRISVIEENDAFAVPPTDRWYTQGLEVDYLSGLISPDRAASLPSLLPVDPEGADLRRFGLSLGQQMFTPVNLSRFPPDPTDRPYAGWLYGGFGLFQESDHRQLAHLELQLGVVGPAALAAQTQDAFHGLSGQVNPRAWAEQLKNEPGVVVSYERKWRIALPTASSVGFDAIPELGASLGNVYTYAEASALVRWGRNLNADYGAPRMRPALSGTTWFDPGQLDGSLGWYLYAGVQGRAMGRDLFLDGNTWRASPSVDKLPFVGDLTAGFSIFWANDFRLDAAWVWRSRQFETQPTIDRYAGINLTFGL